MPKPAALLVFLLLLLGSGYWSLQSPERPATNDVNEFSSEPAKSSSSMEKPHLEEAPNASLTREVEKEQTPRDLAPTHATEDLPFLVEVVPPQAGVEVFLIQDATLIKDWKLKYSGPIAAFDFAAEGARALGPYLTNQSGHVFIPTPGPADLILGTHGDYAGYSIQDRKATSNLLPLYLDPPIRIHVKDESGKNASGLEVALFHGTSAWVKTFTDEHGNATIPFPRLHIQDDLNFRYSVGLVGPGLKRLTEPLPINQVPRTIELTAAGTSGLRFVLQDSSGGAFEGWSTVSFRSHIGRQWFFFRARITPQDRGILLLPQCALNTEFEVFFDFDGRYPKEDVIVKVTTPPNANDVLKVDVQVPGPTISLPFQLLDREGQIIAGRDVYVELNDSENEKRTIGSKSLRTDANGKATATLMIPEKEWFDGNKFKLQLSTMSYPSGGRVEATHLFTLQTGAPSSSEILLQINGPDVLAIGQVIDRNGTPLQGARIMTGKENQTYKPNFSNVFCAISDANGRFLLRGKLRKNHTRLLASWNGQYLKDQPLYLGEEGHILTFSPAPYKVEGSILLPDFLRNNLKLRFKSEDEFMTMDLKKNGTAHHFLFQAQNQTLGTLTLVGYPFDSFAQLEEVLPIPLDAEGDARLHPWDLRNDLDLAEVEIRLGGEKIKSFELSPMDANWIGPLGDSLKIHTADGARFLVAKEGGTKATLSGDKLWDTEVELKPGRQVIQGVAAMRGTLRIPNLPELPNGWKYSLYAKPEKSNPYGEKISEKLDAGDIVEVLFHRQETWNVYLSAEKDSSSRHSPSFRIPLDGLEEGPFLLEIPNGGATFNFMLPVQVGAKTSDWIPSHWLDR